MIRTRLLPVLAALVLGIGGAHAQIPNNAVKIGVLPDASGPFADQSGRGAFVAAQLAAEDFAKEDPNLKVKIVFGDHQNKANVGAPIVRAWIDREGVTAMTEAAWSKRVSPSHMRFRLFPPMPTCSGRSWIARRPLCMSGSPSGT